jgi:hypothetical protein
MTLRARLAKLERKRPAPGADVLELDQATLDAMAKAYADALTKPGPDLLDASFSDLIGRIEKMQAQGLGIDYLTDGELELIVAAGDIARGRI